MGEGMCGDNRVAETGIWPYRNSECVWEVLPTGKTVAEGLCRLKKMETGKVSTQKTGAQEELHRKKTGVMRSPRRKRE